MKDGVIFGKCLNELLMVRGWSAARLARGIGLDASYVRRWIKGERVPSIKSGYVEQIADYLCSGIDEKDTRNLGGNYIIALKELGIKPDSNKPIREIIKDVLTEAQVYSLKFDPSERILHSTTTEDDIVSLLMKIGKNNRGSEKTLAVSHDLDSIKNMPALIKGKQAILHAYITLIKAAAESKAQKKGDIIVTFQGENYPFDGYPQLEEFWQREISNVLAEGWRIKHLLRLSKNVTRSIRLVKRMLEQIGFDKQYEPCYFEDYGTVYPASEALIVPGIGALTCLSAEDGEYIDTAFFYSQAEAVESIQRHYLNMLELANPLLKVYSTDDFFIFSTEMDKKRGDMFCVRGDLGSLTMTYSLWERQLERVIEDEKERAPHLQRLNMRFNSFQELVSRYKLMYICPMEAIEHLVKHREYIYDNVYRLPKPEEIVEHLENVIFLLKKYKNLEIGLINENQKALLPQIYWEVKGDHTAIIEMWYPKEFRGEREETGLFLSITEGTIAGSFRDYFFDIWNKITPKYREKDSVISWLEEQLDWFKRDNGME